MEFIYYIIFLINLIRGSYGWRDALISPIVKNISSLILNRLYLFLFLLINLTRKSSGKLVFIVSAEIIFGDIWDSNETEPEKKVFLPRMISVDRNRSETETDDFQIHHLHYHRKSIKWKFVEI